MIASIRQWQGEPDVLTDFVEHIRGALPLLQQIDGFVSYSAVMSGDTLTTVSVYQDQTGAERSNELARHYTQDEWHIQVNDPRITEGDLVLHVA